MRSLWSASGWRQGCHRGRASRSPCAAISLAAAVPRCPTLRRPQWCTMWVHACGARRQQRRARLRHHHLASPRRTGSSRLMVTSTLLVRPRASPRAGSRHQLSRLRSAVAPSATQAASSSPRSRSQAAGSSCRRLARQQTPRPRRMHSCTTWAHQHRSGAPSMASASSRPYTRLSSASRCSRRRWRVQTALRHQLKSTAHQRSTRLWSLGMVCQS